MTNEQLEIMDYIMNITFDYKSVTNHQILIISSNSLKSLFYSNTFESQTVCLNCKIL